MSQDKTFAAVPRRRVISGTCEKLFSSLVLVSFKNWTITTLFRCRGAHREAERRRRFAFAIAVI
jgi:hypothetical protein